MYSYKHQQLPEAKNKYYQRERESDAFLYSHLRTPCQDSVSNRRVDNFLHDGLVHAAFGDKFRAGSVHLCQKRFACVIDKLYAA